MSRIIIPFIACIILIACANNRFTNQILIKGQYTLVGKSEAESTQIVGVVKDKRTGNILPFAHVSVESASTKEATTDEQGNFKIKVDAGNIRIKVSNFGNIDLTTKTIKIKPKEKLEIHFYLGVFEIN